MPVIGIGADGDSKSRKHFTAAFLTRPGMNRTISIPHRGFDFQSVVMDIDGVAVPTLMFPDWKHLIKKWRNQILNVRRILLLGKGFVMIEELMQLYETKKVRKWPMEKRHFRQRSTKCRCSVKNLAATGPQMLERKKHPKD